MVNRSDPLHNVCRLLEVHRAPVLSPMWSSVCRLSGYEPFGDERGDQFIFDRILHADYDMDLEYWGNVSEEAKVCGGVWGVYWCACV